MIRMEGSKEVMASWLLCLSAKFAFGPSRTFRLHSPRLGGCLGQSGHSPDGKQSLPTSNGELSFPDSSRHALSDVCGQGGSSGAAEFIMKFIQHFTYFSREPIEGSIM